MAPSPLVEVVSRLTCHNNSGVGFGEEEIRANWSNVDINPRQTGSPFILSKETRTLCYFTNMVFLKYSIL